MAPNLHLPSLPWLSFLSMAVIFFFAAAILIFCLLFLTPLLPGSVNVVFELDADLPLCGLVSDEGKL